MTERDISTFPVEAQEYIRELRTEAKDNRLRATELQVKVVERDTAVAQASTKLDELNAQIAQGQEIATKYTTLQEEHTKTATELARINAAREAKLDLNFADRLKGDTPEALKADAEAFKQSLSGTTPSAANDRTNAQGAAGPEPDGLRGVIARHLQQDEE